MVDVVHIELHPLVKCGIASTADLPKAGNAWFDAESAAVNVMFKAKALEILYQEWTRSYQAHIAFQYVPKLWQFV